MTTPSTPQLNDADWELLSAYIDNQLPAEERTALEERLLREPALRVALDELRATVGLLRDLEPVAPPRSFTLDVPAVAPRRAPLFAWMNFGSAVTAVVLACIVIAVFVGRSRVGGGVTGGVAQAPAANAPQALSLESTPGVAAGGAAATTAPASGGEVGLAATSAPAAESAPAPETTAGESSGAPAAGAPQPPAAAGATAAIDQQPTEALVAPTPSAGQSIGSAAPTLAPALAQQATPQAAPGAAYPPPQAPATTIVTVPNAASGTAAYPLPQAPVASGSAASDTISLPPQPVGGTTPEQERVRTPGTASSTIWLGVAVLVLMVSVAALWALRRRR